MCRLFAWHSSEPITLGQALGSDRDLLTDLSHIHCDGWGMSYGDADGLTRVRDVAPAHESDSYARTRDAVAASDAIVHLRMATSGLQVCEVNTHPFVYDGPQGQVAFCHNGGMAQGPELDALIDADLLAGLEGTTDSEQYFAALLSALRRTDGDMAAAYRLLLPQLTAIRHSSLNALVLTDTHVHVLCRNIPANRPDGMDEDYYVLQWGEHDGVVSAWSSGVRAGGGRVLADGELLSIDRVTGEAVVRRVMA